jgi:LysR family glycine cleavage system transcriptional activator
MEADRLAGIELLPVCAPALVEAERLRRPRDLSRCTLIYSLVRERDRAAWLAANGCGGIPSRQEMRLESSALAYEAAMRGSGVAIGIRVLVERDLQAGTLVAPFPRAHVLKDAYYLVRPKSRSPSVALRRFRTWLAQELAEENAA